MTKDSVLEKVRNNIEKATKKEIDKLSKVKDEVEYLKIDYIRLRKTSKVFIDEIKSLTDKQFEKLIEEITQPMIERRTKIMKEMDSVIFNLSNKPEEFEKYKESIKLEEDHYKKLSVLLENTNLDKTTLERYAVFLLLSLADYQAQTQQNNLDYNAFSQAVQIIQDRFGFNVDWLVGVGLIQLHENLIKKKLSQLNESIKGDESISVLISKLSNAIKTQEKRDVKLQLEMSVGLKKIRDIMTHEGYKHKVTKPDLNQIINEVKQLEKILYSDQKTDKN